MWSCCRTARRSGRHRKNASHAQWSAARAPRRLPARGSPCELTKTPRIVLLLRQPLNREPAQPAREVPGRQARRDRLPTNHLRDRLKLPWPQCLSQSRLRESALVLTYPAAYPLSRVLHYRPSPAAPECRVFHSAPTSMTHGRPPNGTAWTLAKRKKRLAEARARLAGKTAHDVEVACLPLFGLPTK